MSPLDDGAPHGPPEPAFGRGAATRRLSDKILAAFAHAYAVGELEVARALRAALVASEARRADDADRRRDYDPLGQADLWVAFVEARDGYKRACAAAGPHAPSVAVALDTMKDAYRRWSAG